MQPVVPPNAEKTMISPMMTRNTTVPSRRKKFEFSECRALLKIIRADEPRADELGAEPDEGRRFVRDADCRESRETREERVGS